MPGRIRLATFNMQNLEDIAGQQPTLTQRINLMSPQLVRLDADILCLQEIAARKVGNTFDLPVLDTFFAGTQYATYNRASASVGTGQRSLVILSRFSIVNSEQILNALAPRPSYQRVTSVPPDTSATPVGWERPILRAAIQIDATHQLQLVNVHFKSRIPTDIPGQKVNQADPTSPWRTASGWAEGSFLSSMKRVGQALETRILIDRLFQAQADALIAVCGDFNADAVEVPVQAIRGDVEDNDNPALAAFTMVACERTVPEPARYSLLHHGQPTMIDHILVSRPLLTFYRHTEIHNELLHDKSQASATDVKYPESDHAPVVAEFEIPP
jgi:predicted extracellular nuclease